MKLKNLNAKILRAAVGLTLLLALCASSLTAAAIAGVRNGLQAVWLRLESVEPIEVRINPDSDDED